MNKKMKLPLEENERVLWHEQAKEEIPSLAGYVKVAVASVFVFAISVISLEHLVFRIFLLLSVGAGCFCLWSILFALRMKKGAYYAVTNQRVMVVQKYPFRRVPAIRAMAVTPDLLKSVKEYQDGRKDYHWFFEQTEKKLIPGGFIKVSDTLGLERIFAELGIYVPAPGEQVSNVAPVVTIQKQAFVFILIAGFFYSVFISFIAVEVFVWDAYLHLFGKSAEAVIVTSRTRTQLEGRRVKQQVTRYYPVYLFITESGGGGEGEVVVAESKKGDKNPFWHVGDKVEILYNPKTPTIVLRKGKDPNSEDISEYFVLGCFLIGVLFTCLSICGTQEKWEVKGLITY